MIPYERSVAHLYPEFADTFDESSEHRPEEVSPSSQKRVTLRCPACLKLRTTKVASANKERPTCPKCAMAATNRGRKKKQPKMFLPFERSIAASPELLRLYSGNNAEPARDVSQMGASYRLFLCVSCASEMLRRVDHFKASSRLCRTCLNRTTSRGETELVAHLSRFGTVVEQVALVRSPYSNRKHMLRADAFLPEHNLVVEYFGDYYHSSFRPRATTPGLWDSYVKKYAYIREGYRIAIVWESDWVRRRADVEESLALAVKGGGMSPLLSKLEGDREPPRVWLETQEPAEDRGPKHVPCRSLF
jgi:hypothetical protein